MRHLQNLESRILVRQSSATAAATITSDNLDIKNAAEIKITVHGTTADAATNSPSVFKIQESDDTVASNFADVTKFVGGGAGGFTIPAAPTATTDKPYGAFNVDPRGLKRYLRMIISPRTTQTFSVVAQIASKIRDVGATEENAAVVVTG